MNSKFAVFAISLFFVGVGRLPAADPAQGLTSIPITFDLPRAGFITLVADDDKGHRVANIIAQQYMPAGAHRVNWDGYDVGEYADAAGKEGLPAITRHRIAAGSYHIHGLIHDGLHLIYQFPVYSPGNPPWFNLAGTGGWLSDHSTPADVVLLPAGASPYGDPKEQQFLFSANLAEEGSALMWADLNGQRLAGAKIDGWTGGYALALDKGPEADPDTQAYTLIAAGSSLPQYVRGGYEIRRIAHSGALIKLFNYDLPDGFVPTDGFPRGPSLAVRNKIAVISNLPNNNLVIVDLNRRELLGTIAMDDPRGVAYDADGNLFVLTGNQLKEYQLDIDKLALEGEKVVVSTGLDDPQRVLVTPDKFYISDWGTSHQVKVFSLDGHPVTVIGKEGTPKPGPYDPLHLQHPLGMTLDPQGRLWVAEHDWLPKRISVWTPDGKLDKAFYGGPQYGGGGMLDPDDKTKFYYASSMSAVQGGLQFNLDWTAGTSMLADVYLRGPSPKVAIMRGLATMWGSTGADHDTFYNSFERDTYPYDLPRSGTPERAIHLNGQLYMTNCFNGWERGNYSNGIFQMQADGTVKPVASAGPLPSLLNRWALGEQNLRNWAAIKEATKNMDVNSTAYVWSDLNGNGFMDVDEMQFRTIEPKHDEPKPVSTFSGMYVDDQLVITTAFGLQLTPTRFNDKGVPVYDLAVAPRLARLGECQPVPGKDGWLANANGPALTGYKNGEEMWRIATYGYYYLPQTPSQIVDPTRLLGSAVTPRKGEAGELFAVNGEKGSIYLITMDGLFVANLGGDMRTSSLVRFPTAERGMDIAGHSLEDENFHPTMQQLTADGEIYLVLGKEYTAVYHLEGLDKLQRLDLGQVEITDDQVAALPETQEEIHEKRDAVTLTIPHVDGAPALDATDAENVTIDGKASAALALTADRLYVTYHTGDPALLNNSGASDPTIFKGGGGLDLMLREKVLGQQSPNELNDGVQPIEGDLRLFVTRVGGKTKAVLFRPVVPNSAETDRVVLNSPIGNVSFDSVADISDEVNLIDNGKGDYQFDVALKALGWKPVSGQNYHGDVGLLRGNGAQTLQRSYWSNKTATIVSDVPSEARLAPTSWGEFRVQ